MRVETASNLVSAACQVEAEFGFEIRFVALIRGDDRWACDFELGHLASTLLPAGLLQRYVVGLDVVRDVFELGHTSSGPMVCRDVARQYDLDLCIDLGESVGRRGPWKSLCEGLDAACTALVDGHHVRLRNGMHIKELVEKLRCACDLFDNDVYICFAIMIRLRYVRRKSKTRFDCIKASQYGIHNIHGIP